MSSVMSAFMAAGSPPWAARTSSSTSTRGAERPDGSRPLWGREPGDEEALMNSDRITIVGGGIAGLVAAILGAEAGREVVLYEAHGALGGRARSTTGPFVANLGPHAIYADGTFWAWLRKERLLPPVVTPALTGARFRHNGRVRRTPPAALLRALLHRKLDAPVDVDFRTWAASVMGDNAAQLASRAAGVATFDADPGRLSAAFVYERLMRAS